MLANKIKRLRLHMGISQVHLAKLLKTSQAAVSHWENGIHEVTKLKLNKLRLLAAKNKFNWGKDNG